MSQDDMKQEEMDQEDSQDTLYAVAIVGMAGRFPGADGLDQLWEVLRRGAETISFFSDEELEASGVTPALRGHPAYVRARGVLRDPELFDAALFGISPREARILDPQQRVFLECAWEALESAACDPDRVPGAVGVYGGVSQGTYIFRHLLGNPEVAQSVSGLELKLGNDRDFLTTTTSYRLNLRGPSVNVSTACSTSLVAVHLACQALLNRECDVALAGGVSVTFPQKTGYVYQEGGIYSADGHVRAFDAAATGSVGGDGVGVVVLKRLEDALREGDPVRAVIRGSAINNDGSLKIGFTAPSVEGQAAVIAEAQNVAGVDPETVTYIETHGSGTPLGDPVEVRALTRAFRAGTGRKGFCAIGSIKTNLGHTDVAAGVAGLIKTALALERRLIPPSVHFERPNPEIPFAETPFYVAARLADWKTEDGQPRRAGVNSFGIGGTNAHVVMEEAPERQPSGPSRPWQLLVLSAATPAALEAATDRLAAHLKSHPEESLADVAYTGQVGRRELRFRRALVCRDTQDALAALRDRDERRLISRESAGGRSVAFLFPGVGDHYPDMARGLYAAEPVFRREIDRCAEILRPLLGIDLRGELFAAPAAESGGGSELRRMLGRSEGDAGDAGALARTEILQPAVFALEMALARLWESWGVRPSALLGYSVGEYAAACQAGVFSLEDGLRIVAERARRIAALPEGGMLAVALPEAALAELLGGDLSLAAVNAPELCVAAGPREPLAALEEELAARGVSCRRLPTTHAFHSAMMEPVVDDFARFLSTVKLAAPRVPYVTNATGTWVTAEQAVDPAHWARHLRAPVRYADGLRALWAEPSRALLEVGPGHGLTTLALQQGGGEGGTRDSRIAVPSLRPAYAREDDQAFLLGAAARLWAAGAAIDWQGVHAGERRRKLVLPAYPFQRQRFWVEARPVTFASVPVETPPPAEPPASYARPDLRTRFAEPRTDSERVVAAVWREVLALEQVGIHDSFFELGGHSLLAPRVLLRIGQEMGVEVPLDQLLAAPTVADLAETVDRLLQGGEAGLPVPQPVDLETEVSLAPEIRREDGSAGFPPLQEAGAVLLTGASGFLGAFLLRDLLRETRAEVWCVVRSDTPEQGRDRILRNLAAHGLALGPGESGRIVPVPGNLAEPRWGLAEADFHALAERIDAVFHAGAWVNFTYPYELLKPTNVGGTDEALRLAALGRPKPVHFVSSLSVFAAGSYTADGVALETSSLPASRGLFGGYPQTKWVAERRIAIARERGIPVAVYRPGVISGDARSGIGNTRDLIWSFLKACLQLERAPEGMPGTFDPVPVDFVSRAILHLAERPDSLGRAFHLFNPRPMTWSEVFAGLADLGYPLRIVPPEEWHRELERAVRSTEGQALAPFWPLLGNSVNRSGSRSGSVPVGTETPRETPGEAPPAARPVWRFDGSQTREALDGSPDSPDSAVVCPPADRELLETYVRQMQDSGFFPSPVAGKKGTLP